MKTFLTFLFLLTGFTVSAQEPVFLKDFAALGADAFLLSPEINGLTVNNQLLFLVDDGRHGKELWRTNGTEAGTQLLKDIFPDEGDSDITLLAVIGNNLYFRANDGEHGTELWTTQGTASSTQLVKDIYPGTQGSIGQAVILDNALIFTAFGEQGTELYRSEGTEAKTFLLKDINPNISGNGNPFTSNPHRLTTAGNLVFLSANDGINGSELWKTNGTAAGTEMVKDINQGPGFTLIDQMHAAGNLVYFECNGLELWRSDGTAEGTFPLEDLKEEGTSIQFMGEVNSVFYFIVRESNINRYLWKSDGTEEGTVMVGEGINTREFYFFNGQLFFRGNNRLWKADGVTEEEISDVNVAGEFAGVGDELFFAASESGSGNGLWKTDGTPESVTRVKEITSASFREITHMKGAGNHVFFLAETEEFGIEIWASDGTEENTFMLVDGAPGEDDGFRSSDDVTYGIAGDMLFFAGKDESHGRELWSSDGTIEGTRLVKDINARSQDIQIYAPPIAFNDQTFFITVEGLWKTDGSPENTVLLKELTAGSGLNLLGDKLLFTASNAELARTIWTSDGTPEGTQPLFNELSGQANLLLFQSNLPKMNGYLFFSGRDNEHNNELWKTDGTAEGTSMVKDINEGDGYSFFGFNDYEYAIIDGILYFAADDGFLGTELWKTDGTEAGTLPVSDINPFGSSAPSNMTAVKGTLYFSADDGTAGYELWKSDGTTEGTEMVKDILPGEDDGVRFVPLVSFQDMVFFNARDAVNGQELWKSDGTEEGTVMVKDIYPAENGVVRQSNPRNMKVIGNTLFFVATDATGMKVWRSDGTEEGTETALDFEANFLTTVTPAGNMLLFAVNDGERGFELWRSGPDLEDPVRMTDIVPGSRSADPMVYDFNNGTLYFTAVDDIHGRELWTLTPFTVQVNVGVTAGELCNPDDTVTIVASAADAGNGAEYEWYVNNVPVGGENSNTFASAGFTDGDQVKVLVVAGNDVWVKEDSVFSESLLVSFSIPDAGIIVSGNTLTASEGAAYRWFLDNDLLPDITQGIIIKESGVYQVEVSNDFGCSALSDPIAIVVNVNAIENNLLAGKVNIYPNPASSHFYLESHSQEVLRLSIHDLGGQLICHELILPQENHHAIPIEGFAEGIYLIRLVGERDSMQFKLIKQ